MNVVSTIVNAVVIGAVGVFLAWFIKDRFGGFDERMDRLDERMDRLERRVDLLQSSLDATRSDLTQVALAVGAKPRASNR